MDAPSGTSNLEGSDAGLGERVSGEPPSHGCDSANVSGHAVPAVPHGNQVLVPDSRATASPEVSKTRDS